MKKAVAYLRVSTDEQGDRYGFDRQLNDITTYAQAHNIEIVEIFRESVSGATDPLKERVEFPRMLKYTEKNPDVKCIIISELSRLACKVKNQEEIIEDFQYNRGLELISVAEPDLDSEDPSRVAMRQLSGVMNQYERAVIVARMKAGRMAKARSGGHAGGRVPTGYRSVVKDGKKVLEKVDREAEVVKLIFRLRDEEGMSFREIAKYLNDEGYKTKYNNDFAYSSVRKIYLNPKYKGIVKYQEGDKVIVSENADFRLVN